jgi:hypothetical protein
MFKELLFVEAFLALQRKPSGFCGMSKVPTSKSDLAFTLALSKSDAMCVTLASVACALSSLRMRKNSIVKIIPRPLYAHRAASVIGSILPE